MISVINLEIGKTYVIVKNDLEKERSAGFLDFCLKRDYVIKCLLSEKEKNPFNDYYSIDKDYYLFFRQDIMEFLNKYKININKAKFTIIDKYETDYKIIRTKITFINEKTINNVEKAELTFDKLCFAKAVVIDNKKSIPLFLFDDYRIELYLNFLTNKQTLDLYGCVEYDDIGYIAQDINESIKNNILLLTKEYLSTFKKEKDYYNSENFHILDIMESSEMRNRLNNKTKTILRQITTQVSKIAIQEEKRWNYLSIIPFRRYR